ncbi:MAG: hypothetical protein M3Q69_16625, partial [Acidobacteriota bacterium]|nr:hypothetical protein [Acidobacteriota bacterium]
MAALYRRWNDERRRAAITYDNGAAGAEELLAELQRRLGGFDNKQLAAAMLSTSNARFVVWS